MLSQHRFGGAQSRLAIFLIDRPLHFVDIALRLVRNRKRPDTGFLRSFLRRFCFAAICHLRDAHRFAFLRIFAARSSLINLGFFLAFF